MSTRREIKRPGNHPVGTIQHEFISKVVISSKQLLDLQGSKVYENKARTTDELKAAIWHEIA